MEIRTLYKYKRKDGGTTVSTEMPAQDTPYTEIYRIIAGEGMLVTQDGENKYPVIDTNKNEGWYEVEAPEPEEQPSLDGEE